MAKIKMVKSFLIGALLVACACSGDPAIKPSDGRGDEAIEKGVSARKDHPAVERIVFVGRKDACDCTRKQIDASWNALQAAMEGYRVMTAAESAPVGDVRAGALSVTVVSLASLSVYLVPLMEHLSLRSTVAAFANPKSSTGRLDVFTRLIADYQESFDSVEEGYKGPLYTEICPRTFSIKVRSGSRLNQIRFRRRVSQQSDEAPGRVGDKHLRAIHSDVGLVEGEAAEWGVKLHHLEANGAAIRAVFDLDYTRREPFGPLSQKNQPGNCNPGVLWRQIERGRRKIEIVHIGLREGQSGGLVRGSLARLIDSRGGIVDPFDRCPSHIGNVLGNDTRAAAQVEHTLPVAKIGALLVEREHRLFGGVQVGRRAARDDRVARLARGDQRRDAVADGREHIAVGLQLGAALSVHQPVDAQ